MSLPLIALFIAAFAFGTTEFVIAGVLPQVAEGLGVSVPSAGYLVSGYACGIAIGGPLLALATGKVSRKTLLIGLTIAFTLGQAACALAPDFTSMLLLRIATAVAHGCYFGVAMVVAVSLVREDQRGRAVAVILSGLTVSNVIGVPAGTAIGSLWGWRATFWVMGTLGIIAIVAMLALLPRTAGAANRPAGLARAIGQIPICWAPDRQQAIDLAHEQFRWFGGGWYVNADLPTPAGFDAASQFVRKEDVAGSIACGPDLDELAESVRPYLRAGFTDVALVQVGDALQQEFLDKAAGPLLDKLRALAP